METEDKYILDEDGNPVPEKDLLKWAKWLETAGEKRRIAYTEIGGIVVSTVFLGMDHNFTNLFGEKKESPILWETIVFEKEMTEEVYNGITLKVQKTLPDYGGRYSSREEAIQGHESTVSQLRAIGYK